jgi:hypothetical protein
VSIATRVAAAERAAADFDPPFPPWPPGIERALTAEEVAHLATLAGDAKTEYLCGLAEAVPGGRAWVARLTDWLTDRFRRGRGFP